MAHHYETHITLATADPPVLDVIRIWAEAQQLKWTQIVLDAGGTPLQPMITFWGRGSLAIQRQRADSTAKAVASQGGAVVRVKVEVTQDDDGSSLTDPEPPADSTSYFEHHVKVLLNDQSDIARLSHRAAESGARLSHNARRRRPDGGIERFVTQRVYEPGSANAKSKLARLLQDLDQAGFEILEVEAEFVVYDSNLAVDSGWLQPSSGG